MRDQLEAMGARVTEHAVNRVDFAMDFRTQAFELHQDQFVAHSHTKVSPHWGKRETAPDRDQPAAVVRGRRLESVTIGKQPGRQIIVYDKRREAIERQKPFWFEAWGVDRADPTLEVWRVEVRAGKKELKDKYRLRTFRDIADSIGDVLVNALQEVRYLADGQRDSNVTRQTLHPLSTEAQTTAARDLLAFRSGLTPDQVLDTERALVLDRHIGLCAGNAIAWGSAKGLPVTALPDNLPGLIAEALADRMAADARKTDQAYSRARRRQRFLTPTRS